MSTATVPDITPGYPSKGKKLGPAWERVWAKLDATDYRDGQEIARAVAAETDLSPATLVALISRAAKQGLLLTRPRRVKVPMEGRETPVIRVRTFYRISARGVKATAVEDD
jgi:hypothetical protein